MTGVEVGDRVRVTCGESINVGTVAASNHTGIYVRIDGDGPADSARHFQLRDWTVEVILLPVPDIAGTIVIDRHNAAWQRDATGWRCVQQAGTVYRLKGVQKTHGPLTVVWEPTP